LAALAEAEFGGFPIVRETVWAIPDWSFVGSVGEQVACFYHLVLREGQFDGEAVLLAGLNNLVTVPQFRGRGLASRLLRDTEAAWYDRFGAGCGLLLCADALLPFYSRLGWGQVRSKIRFAQPGGPRVWAANCMLTARGRPSTDPAQIDLCGLPW
jgi:GNAT superfamily N-acetyltransferase